MGKPESTHGQTSSLQPPFINSWTRSAQSHLGGCFFFQSGSCSPRAQLMKPPMSLEGSFGAFSMTSKISSRSELGSVIFPVLVGTPLIGANRLQPLTLLQHWGRLDTVSCWRSAQACPVEGHINCTACPLMDIVRSIYAAISIANSMTMLLADKQVWSVRWRTF